MCMPRQPGRLPIDELTGIFNRRFFDAAIEREVKQAARRNRELSLLIIDIDNFKSASMTRTATRRATP
jgi:diguanylate cyclase (GGDEF)-like protein